MKYGTVTATSSYSHELKCDRPCLASRYTPIPTNIDYSNHSVPENGICIDTHVQLIVDKGETLKGTAERIGMVKTQ
jgi:hypothetical protein